MYSNKSVKKNKCYELILTKIMEFNIFIYFVSKTNKKGEYRIWKRNLLFRIQFIMYYDLKFHYNVQKLVLGLFLRLPKRFKNFCLKYSGIFYIFDFSTISNSHIDFLLI